MAGANCSRRDARVQFGAAQGGSAAEPRLGGFCQLVRAVSPLVANMPLLTYVVLDDVAEAPRLAAW